MSWLLECDGVDASWVAGVDRGMVWGIAEYVLGGALQSILMNRPGANHHVASAQIGRISVEQRWRWTSVFNITKSITMSALRSAVRASRVLSFSTRAVSRAAVVPARPSSYVTGRLGLSRGMSVASTFSRSSGAAPFHGCTRLSA